MRLSAVIVAVALVGITAGRAVAHPPPDPEDEERQRPPIEWSTWFRLGYGLESKRSVDAARTTTPQPPPARQGGTWDAALGADITLGVASDGNVRFGPWIEARGTSVVGGAELVLTGAPKRIDMFLYDGTGILALRAGGNAQRVTGAIAYGYLAPWRLWGPWRGSARYMIGVRLVASVTRAIEDARDWTATVGIEVEPFGALRYLLGIRSLYR
jgi:hypothetical protein